MKRTYERILFMIIGALIAFCAYLVGNIDNDSNAKEIEDPDFGHVVQCDTLLVNDTILVGTGETGQILLQAKPNSAAITVKHSTTGTIAIMANDNEVTNKVVYGDLEDPDSYIAVGTSKSGALVSAQSKKSIAVGFSHNEINEILMFINENQAGMSIKDGNGTKLVNTIDVE